MAGACLKISRICADASSSPDRTLAEREHEKDSKSEKTKIVIGALSDPAEPTGQTVDIVIGEGALWHPVQGETPVCGAADTTQMANRTNPRRVRDDASIGLRAFSTLAI
jgi:hypothetical protein